MANSLKRPTPIAGKTGRKPGELKSKVRDRYKLNDMEVGEWREYPYHKWLYDEINGIVKNKNRPTNKHGMKFKTRAKRNENDEFEDSFYLIRVK